MAISDPPDIALARAKTDLDGDGIITQNDFDLYTDLWFLVYNYDTANSGGGTATPTLTTNGRYILDRCGNRLVFRGYEQRLRNDIVFPAGKSFPWMIDEMALTGANAVRFLPEVANTDPTVNVSLAQITAALDRVVANNMVAEIHLDSSWFAQPAVKTALQPYLGYIVATIFGEPSYDNRTQWQTDAIAAIQTFRAAGYQIPIVVLANNYGRDLPGVLQNGPAIVAADPLNRTIICWQGYWNAWYQNYYGMTLAQAAQAISTAPFPINMGLTYVADAGTTVDYQQEMALADQYGIGWLYWHYHNRPTFDLYNISVDGSSTNLMNEGNVIIHTDAHSFDHVPPVHACNGSGGGTIPLAPSNLVLTIV